VEGNNGGEIDLALMYRSEDGESFNLDLDCQGGDGLYKADQLFAVYERKDLGQLIKALYVAYGQCGFIDDAWANVDMAIANLKLES
jgi:hypothetical protein